MSTTNTQVPPPPAIRPTEHDRYNSGLIALLGGMGLLVSLLIMQYLGLKPETENMAHEIEIVEDPGGSLDGSPDEELRVDSPEPEDPNASLAEIEADQNEIEQMMDNVMDIAETASTQIADRQFELETENSGKVGSASGTGKRALGFGPGKSGFPREQRWFIAYADESSLDEYARQLDYFEIVLGALNADRSVIYLSNVSTPQPTVNRVGNGEGEKRLFMVWQGGSRRLADLKLFKKAGIDAAGATVLQFYPPPLEEKLAKLERQFKGLPVSKIRRTYFKVIKNGSDYDFQVTQQIEFH